MSLKLYMIESIQQFNITIKWYSQFVGVLDTINKKDLIELDEYELTMHHLYKNSIESQIVSFEDEIEEYFE